MFIKKVPATLRLARNRRTGLSQKHSPQAIREASPAQAHDP